MLSFPICNRSIYIYMCAYIFIYIYIHTHIYTFSVIVACEFKMRVSTFFPRKSCILKSPTKKRSSKFSNSNPTKPNKTPFRHLNSNQPTTRHPQKKRAFSSTSNLQYHHSLRSHLGGFVRILEENHNQTKPRYMILDMHRWIKESTWLPRYLFQTIDVFCIMCSRIDQKSIQIQENPTILFFFSIYILASISPMQNPLAQKKKIMCHLWTHHFSDFCSCSSKSLPAGVTPSIAAFNFKAMGWLNM